MRLHFEPALTRPDLLAAPVQAALAAWAGASGVSAAAIDPELADTAAFCAAYEIELSGSANCVLIAARRGDTVQHAACVVLATTRADVNGAVRRHLEARKASFAALTSAVSLTGMEYGGITPIGLPASWPVLLDPAVLTAAPVVIGSGLRASKLQLVGEALADLPGAVVLPGLAVGAG